LVIQNTVWTTDRLERRGWQNQKVCPLCYMADEYADHLLAKYRATLTYNWISGMTVTQSNTGGT
ncbi:Os01g0138100, partial [Oryza sativa Japonica Group]